MPILPGEKYDKYYTGIPPGMSREDNFLWQLYRPVISDSIEAIYFNVYLGKGVDPGEHEQDKWRKFWIQKTQLRADCLLVYPGTVKIVEFRDRASTSVIGRLLAYKMLLTADNLFRRPISGEVVTNRYDEVVELLCKSNGFTYTVL